MRDQLARLLTNLRRDLAFRPVFEHWLLLVIILLIAGMIVTVFGLLG